tara:strand:+ start:3039 stop:3767 length:729 start_codon:yes stop_codon:yes gene_type:complete
MEFINEILIISFLTVVQSIFGVGLLLFGTPSFLLLGYDFANTLNILMPISILISSLQFYRSKIKDSIFIKNYNLYCIPFLILFLILALNYRDIINFKLYVAILLIFSSLVILNKRKFSSFKKIFFKFKNFILMVIGAIHGFTNMGGSFLAIYSTLVGKNNKEIARYYISYGYLMMGIIQYLIVLLLAFDEIDFTKFHYALIAFIIYFPTQKIFININDLKFTKYINLIALLYGILILSNYFN